MASSDYELINENFKEMSELKKLFNTAFIFSAVPSLLYLLLGFFSLISIIITAGKVAPSAGFLFILLLSVVSLVCFSFSRMMEKKATMISIAVLVFLLIMYCVNENPLFFILSLAGFALQCVCFTKYKRLDFLKSQEGYPYFNTLLTSNQDSKRYSDNEIMKNYNYTSNSEKDTDKTFMMEEINTSEKI
ncbi:MAG: hypothetical protein IJF18_01805 [Oscillospiraceae bacterium]|nr:hypothetical protein [Oscillospiraceae bacterium]